MSLSFSPDQLALVHVTALRPTQTDQGWVLETAFQRAGGHAQDPEAGTPRFRQTLHYTLQSAVTDHAYGSFEGRPYAVVAPLTEAVQANGRPESLLASDVAFFPKQGQMVLPGAVVVKFANDLPPDVFIQREENGVLRVSTELGGPNLEQARSWFSQLSAQGHDVSAVEQMLAREDQEWTTPEVTEIGVSAALAEINKPNLHHLMGISPGAPMGFDGWLPQSELLEVKQHLEGLAPSEDMGPIAIGRHDGLAGDRLMRAASLANPALLQEIQDIATVPERIRQAAERWKESPLLQRQRAVEIWRELRNGPSLIANDLGQERPGMVRTLFAQSPVPFFNHPRLGTVSAEEVDRVVRQGTPEQRNDLLTATVAQATDTGLSPAYQRLARWLNELGARMELPLPTMEATGPLPPPPPQVEVTGADVTFPSLAQWRQQRAHPGLDAFEDPERRPGLRV